MEKRTPSLLQALIPILFLIGLLSLNVALYGDSTLDGSNQLALLFAAAVAGLISMQLGFDWKEILAGAVKGINAAMPAILILLVIGSLAGTWMISGIVPAMIYYGLKVLTPGIFLFAACLISIIVSISIGSSWNTIATVGIALMGIGTTLGWSMGIVAGAIISGAYFGDKMSPLSDTTNLAPAVAGTDLFTHIRYMTITTVPAIVITLIIFLVIGFTQQSAGDANAAEMLASLDQTFNINLALFLVPAAVVFMIIKKVPAIPALLVGSLLGGVFAIIFQPEVVKEVSGITDNYAKASYMAVINAMGNETSVTSEHPVLKELLGAGGMYGMLNTIWLIIVAMIFGGIMEAGGLLKRVTDSIISMAKSTGDLILSTAGTCIFFNVTASDQYLAIVVPGRMFANTFKERGLAPENLSRTLEDTGTVTSVLVPWNTCGAFQSGVLGVATLTYLPYCFFNFLSPIMTILVGYIGYRIAKLKPEEVEAQV